MGHSNDEIMFSRPARSVYLLFTCGRPVHAQRRVIRIIKMNYWNEIENIQIE
jgi:hypothetical protein